MKAMFPYERVDFNKFLLLDKETLAEIVMPIGDRIRIGRIISDLKVAEKQSTSSFGQAVSESSETIETQRTEAGETEGTSITVTERPSIVGAGAFPLNNLPFEFLSLSQDSVEATSLDDNRSADQALNHEDSVFLYAEKIKNLLQSSLQGLEILHYYEKFNALSDNCRKKLVDFILAEELKKESKYKISSSLFKTISEAIVEVFPTEKVGVYYIPYRKFEDGHQNAQGKLVDKYSNRRTSLRSIGLLSPVKKRCSQTLQVVSDSRINDLHELNNSQEYITKFAALATSGKGHELILEDFKAKFPHFENNFILNWSTVADKIINFAIIKTTEDTSFKHTLNKCGIDLNNTQALGKIQEDIRNLQTTRQRDQDSLNKSMSEILTVLKTTITMLSERGFPNQNCINLNSLPRYENLPLESEEELKRFEETLETKENYHNLIQWRKEVVAKWHEPPLEWCIFSNKVNYMKSLGGSFTKDAVKNCLKKFLDVELAAIYSPQGGNGKKKFTALKIHSAIIDAVKERLPGMATDAEMKKVIADFLRNAPARAKQRRKLLEPNSELPGK